MQATQRRPEGQVLHLQLPEPGSEPIRPADEARKSSTPALYPKAPRSACEDGPIWIESVPYLRDITAYTVSCSLPPDPGIRPSQPATNP